MDVSELIEKYPLPTFGIAGGILLAAGYVLLRGRGQNGNTSTYISPQGASGFPAYESFGPTLPLSPPSIPPPHIGPGCDPTSDRPCFEPPPRDLCNGPLAYLDPLCMAGVRPGGRIPVGGPTAADFGMFAPTPSYVRDTQHYYLRTLRDADMQAARA